MAQYNTQKDFKQKWIYIFQELMDLIGWSLCDICQKIMCISMRCVSLQWTLCEINFEIAEGLN